MSDLISRQAALDAFNTDLNELVVGGEKNAKTVENYLNGVLDKIKRLPSAQPERTGKWIMTWNKWFKADLPVCSSCSVGSPYKTNFCPNCGARMEVDNEKAKG